MNRIYERRKNDGMTETEQEGKAVPAKRDGGENGTTALAGQLKLI
jgi:hypothetical protein